MKVTLNEAITAPAITETEILNVSMDLDGDFRPKELKISLRIGEKEEQLTFLEDEIDACLSVVVTEGFNERVALRIDGKGKII